MIKFTTKEIELMSIVLSYKKTPTHGQIAMKTNKDQRTISSSFHRMRERHRVRSNEELIKLFKERFPNDSGNSYENSSGRSNGSESERTTVQKSSVGDQLMQDTRSNECNL